MKGLQGFLGLVEGLKLGTIASLDNMSDEHVLRMMKETLRRVAAATKLPKPRQQRLLQLLRDAALAVSEEP